MIKLKVIVQCDVCPNSFEYPARLSDAQIRKMPQSIRGSIRWAEEQAKYGIVEVNGVREHRCPECWAEEFGE